MQSPNMQCSTPIRHGALMTADEQCTLLAGTVNESYEGVARTCRGGIMEAEVVLGLRDARSVIAEINDGLNDVIDLTTIESGDMLESYGWWCIFGCNISIRHISDEPRSASNDGPLHEQGR